MILERYDPEKTGFLSKSDAEKFFSYVFSLPTDETSIPRQKKLRAIFLKLGVTRYQKNISRELIIELFQNASFLLFVNSKIVEGDEVMRRMTNTDLD